MTSGRTEFWAMCLKTLAIIGLCLPGLATAATDLAGFVTESERELARAWMAAHLGGSAAGLPFSFQYGDASSRGFLDGWDAQHTSETIDKSRTRHTLTLVDPKTQLQVRAVAVEYHDFPAIEWTLHFRNDGPSDTPLLSKISSVDFQVSRDAGWEYVLHHNKGARASGSDFEPYETALALGEKVHLRTIGGRPSNGMMPYFNVAWPRPERGVVFAIGWPGQWEADFVRDIGTTLHIQAGQENPRFKLRPGEEVRSPLIAVVWYEGDWLRGQNMWRRWMVQHNVPRQQGELAPTQLVACSSHQFAEMINANEENQKLFIDRYLEEKLPLSHWWMDAGWYLNDGSWVNTGTWEVDRERFPRGLRAVTDHAHARGLKSIVWFEPERVTLNSWIYENHPEWTLKAPPNPGGQLYDETNWRLFNLGNKAAHSWLVEHINDLIYSEGIDVYRQDFNIDPLYYWRHNDEPDREGITEIKYCTGYLAYWDAILNRHPGIRIDSCASGGRRNDLETLRRSVPFVRSDHLFEPASQQSHNYGFSMWVPYHGTGTHVGHSAIGQHSTTGVDVYAFRSHMSCTVTACWDMRDKDLDYDTLRKLTAQMAEASPNFLGDYYPLTPYASEIERDVWIAWQWDRPEENHGAIQAFRRAEDVEPRRRFRLRGLDPEASYRVNNVDREEDVVMRGAELLRDGLTIELPEARSAALILYSKADQ